MWQTEELSRARERSIRVATKVIPDYFRQNVWTHIMDVWTMNIRKTRIVSHWTSHHDLKCPGIWNGLWSYVVKQRRLYYMITCTSHALNSWSSVLGACAKHKNFGIQALCLYCAESKIAKNGLFWTAISGLGWLTEMLHPSLESSWWAELNFATLGWIWPLKVA